MVIKKALYPLIILISLILNAAGQQQSQEIKIGERLPDLLIEVLNKSEPKVNLSSLYKDRLLIIDFWATWCVPCIWEMKFLDSLKGKHPDQFNALMVTSEDRTEIQNFLSKPNNKDIKTQNLILAANDTLLRKLFPHRGIPHNIWVDKNGIVRAITGGGAVTAENILGFDDPQKRAEIRAKQEDLGFDPLSVRFSAGDTSFTYRSIITPRLKGIYSGGELYVPKADKIQRFFMWGVPMLRAYWAAYSGFNMHMRYHLMEIHTQDSLKFYHPHGKYKQLLKKSKYKTAEDWEDDHTYFYDLTLPDAVADTVFRNYMFNDLERQFNVKAKIETRAIPCIVVAKTKGKPLKLSINNGNNPPEINMLIGYKISIKNANMQDFVNYLFKNFGKTEEVVPDPFINTIKKSEDKRFDLDLDFSKEIDVSDPKITAEMIYEKLSQYGFKFKKEIKPYPILVLYDQDNQ